MLDRVRGSHHVYYNPQTKRRVVIPFHKRELPKGTLLEILKQAGVAKEELEVLLWVETLPGIKPANTNTMCVN